MPPLSSSPDAGLAPDQDTAFEDALERLESIVREMESDQVPLSRLIECYEEGSRLHQTCQRLLDSARGRLEYIRDRGRLGVSLESPETGSTVPPVAETEGGASTPPAARLSRKRVEADKAEELF